MTFAKEYNQHTKREISIDVDALLNAVAGITGETVQEHEDNKEAHMVTVQGRQYTTFGELAELVSSWVSSTSAHRYHKSLLIYIILFYITIFIY